MRPEDRISSYLHKTRPREMTIPQSPSSFAAFVSSLSLDVDSDFIEELYQRMASQGEGPTLEFFAGTYIEALRRLSGKIVDYSAMAARARSIEARADGFEGLDESNLLALRLVSLGPLAGSSPRVEFSQGRATVSTDATVFRTGDVILCDVDLSFPVDVALIDSYTNRTLGACVLPPDLPPGRRLSLDLPLREAPLLSVAFEAHVFVSPEEYLVGIQDARAREIFALEELVRDHEKALQSLLLMFPPELIDPTSLEPLRAEESPELEFQNHPVTTQKFLVLGDRPSSAPGFDPLTEARGNPQHLHAHLFDNFGQESRTSLPDPSPPPVPLTPQFRAAPAPSFSSNLTLQPPRPAPLPVSPSSFKIGTFEGIPYVDTLAQPPVTSPHPQIPQIFSIPLIPSNLLHLATGLSLMAMISCVSRCAYPPLTIGLLLACWPVFAEPLKLHHSPRLWLAGFSAALVFDLLFLAIPGAQFWNASWHRDDKSHRLLDKFVYVIAIAMTIVEGACIYYCFLVDRETKARETLSSSSVSARRTELNFIR